MEEAPWGALALALVAVGAAAYLYPVLFKGGKFPAVPGSNLFFGHVLHILDVDKTLDVMDSWVEKHGTSEFRIFNTRFVLISDMDDVRKIMRLRPRKVQRYRLIKYSTDSFAKGLFGAEVPEWGPERRIIAPAFGHANLSTYVKRLRAIATRLTEAVGAKVEAAEGGPVLVDHLMHCFTADVIANIGMGENFGALDGKPVPELVDTTAALDILAKRVFAPFPYFTIPVIGEWLDLGLPVIRRLNASMVRFVRAATGKAAADGGASGDQTILDKFIEMNQLEGGGLSDDRLAGNVLTLFIAGSETTSRWASWCVFHLAGDEDLQDECRREAATLQLRDDMTFAEILEGLPTMRSLLWEVLRLKGAGSVLYLENTQDPIEVAGRTLEPGEYVMAVPLRYLGTCKEAAAEVGPDPHAFKARRWLDSDGKLLPMPPRLLPFGGGARICPGKDLAELEVLIALCHLLGAYDLSVDAEATADIVSIFAFTMRPSRDIPVTFVPRR